MQANRRKNTQPELRLRRLLHARGLRYFVDRAPSAQHRYKADLVFPGAKVAVFVDGCYWHGCPDHFNPPKVNSDYWGPKIQGNKARDRRVDQLLTDEGWNVIRVWEHEIPEVVADRIESEVRSAHT